MYIYIIHIPMYMHHTHVHVYTRRILSNKKWPFNSRGNGISEEKKPLHLEKRLDQTGHCYPGELTNTY